MSPGNELTAARQRPTLVDRERDSGLRATLALAEELFADARERGLAVDGVGAGFPEYVDRGGRLRSHEVLAWTTQPSELLAHIGPVTVESDVRCAALGEAARGVAQGLDSFAFVIVGTGISFAHLEGGRPRPGARGEAIALGELEVSSRIEADGPVTLERYASGEAIRARYAALTGREVAGAVDVFRHAGHDDPAAAAIVRTAGEALGDGLATLVWLLDPGAIVVGGGVSAATGPWRDALLSAYAARVDRRPGSPPILWASLGSATGIIGAAIAHRSRQDRSACHAG